MGDEKPKKTTKNKKTKNERGGLRVGANGGWGGGIGFIARILVLCEA